MNKYSYSGPVMMFNVCVSNNWKGSTFANSKNEAKRNLTYQCKKELNRVTATSLSLPGEIILIKA